MRYGRQETIDGVCRKVMGGWRNGIGIVCLVLGAAVVSPAQDDQISPNTVTFKNLVKFTGPNGSYPRATVTQGGDGNLYGTTSAGGTSNCGTVFKISPAGTLTTLHNFNCTDGNLAGAPLTLGTDGDFYTLTLYGGTNGYGTIFKITPTGMLTTLYSFSNTNGCYPSQTPLVQATNGYFYGVAANNCGGGNGKGTIFKMTPAGMLTTLFNFNLTDGAAPSALVQATDGNFYGTASSGGPSNAACSNPPGCGTFFKMTPSGTLTTLYSFTDSSDGAGPEALIQASDGDFYGTTIRGGSNGFGTLFRITPAGVLTTIYNFSSSVPTSFSLIQATDGNFYGGFNIWQITPQGVATTLHSFPNNVANGVTQATSGKFYGTTAPNGTVFSLAVGLGPFAETVPTSGEVGEVIRILGTDLNGATGVSFNGTAAGPIIISNTEISATVPAGATTGFVTVTTPTRTLKSNVKFQVRP